MADIAIQCDHVWKRFTRGERADSLRDALPALARWVLRRRRAELSERQFWALSEVSFEVQRGEVLGIIGPNGAGKSTVLKLLAGILRADRGEVLVNGRLAALIEVGAGFHGDLTGRENVFLNGAILGMGRAEIRRKLDQIVEFAGIARFLDTPVKRYSSGMYARLGFSIAAHVDPEVLLVDEVLSVGDAVFRLRCDQRMRQLVQDGTTLVFVTHNLQQMQSICPRAIVLDHGRGVFDGSAREAVGYYMTAMSDAYVARATDVSPDGDDRTEMVKLLGLRFLNEHGEDVAWLTCRQAIRTEVRFELPSPVGRLAVELNLRATTSENLLSINSGRDDRFFNAPAGVNVVTLTIPALPLAGGRYCWNVRMWDADTGATLLDTPFEFPLVIDDEGRATGTLALEHEWTFASFPAGDAAAVDRNEMQVTDALSINA
ncbi:MAG: ABC transporter ATP-binding protein, partial [Planctomycetes bacterium]|nr:ABC transporter ATP-binding protein [Planctomycetota bacterium]